MAAIVMDGLARLAMVEEAVHSWPWSFWREWLGCAHLSGMYPSSPFYRGFDACSTSSLRLVSTCLATCRDLGGPTAPKRDWFDPHSHGSS